MKIYNPTSPWAKGGTKKAEESPWHHLSFWFLSWERVLGPTEEKPTEMQTGLGAVIKSFSCDCVTDQDHDTSGWHWQHSTEGQFDSFFEVYRSLLAASSLFSFFSLPTGSYPAASGLPYRFTVCSFKTVLTAASSLLFISDASPRQSWRCSSRIPGSDSGYKQKQCSLSLTAGQSALWREVLQLSAGTVVHVRMACAGIWWESAAAWVFIK